MKLLERISSPKDLKKLEVDELPALAGEIRKYLIEEVSKHGGHIASSLGTVELAIALHYIYEAPEDKLLWDVGHQAYPHKLLTGRLKGFSTLREFGGISGFPRPSESPYDAFVTGHASTSISTGLGMAMARDIKKEHHSIVAVIGDGAMSGGLAFEGMNNLGTLSTDMTIVLNDNRMSISKNVGALSRYLTRVITDKRYNKIKNEVWQLLGNLSNVGKQIRSLVQNVDETLKHFVIPGKLFEDLGLRYIGPVNGHDIAELTEVLRFIKNDTSGPVLLHTITTKGKGYRFAEKDATKYHGIGKFSPKTGTLVKKTKKAPSYSSVFGDTLVQIAEKNRNIVAITAAMTDGTGLVPFKEKFPDRFFDVGIAEGHAVTFASGLAREGLQPVVAVYSTFLQRAYDQIIHDVAIDKLNVIFAIDRGGIVGEDGPTHHGMFDLSYLHAVPGVVILAPSDENELSNMLESAVEYKNGPVFIRYPRGSGTGCALDGKITPIEKIRPRLLSKGGKYALISSGPWAELAGKAVNILKKDKVSMAHIDARIVKPLDDIYYSDLFDKYSHIITLENNTVEGGFGSAVLEKASKLGKNPRILTLGCPDSFVEHGSTEVLIDNMGLTPEKICEKIRPFINR